MGDFARPLSDVRLANGLEGIHTLGVLFSDLHNLAKGAFANDLEKLESINCELFIAGRLEVNLEVE